MSFISMLRAYGLLAALLALGSGILYAGFLLMDSLLSQDFERTAFATMLLIGIPLSLISVFSIGRLSAALNIPVTHLEYAGKAAMLGAFMSMTTLEDTGFGAVDLMRFVVSVFANGAGILVCVMGWMWIWRKIKTKKGQPSTD